MRPNKPRCIAKVLRVKSYNLYTINPRIVFLFLQNSILYTAFLTFCNSYFLQSALNELGKLSTDLLIGMIQSNAK